MRYMHKINFILIPCLLLVLSGCWSKKELNDLSIATGIGIDVVEEGFFITAQIINPAEVAAKELTTRVPITTYSATGTSIFEAIRNLIEQTPRRVYLSHTRVVVFSEKLAEKGISDVLDFLMRDHELRTDFYIVIAKGETAEQMLKVLTPLEKIPSSKIYSSIETNEQYLSQTRTVKIQQLVSDLLLKGQEPYLTGITVLGDPRQGNSLTNVEKIDSPSQIKVEHIAVLKNDKLIGWLNRKESKGFNYLTGHVKSAIEVVECEDDKKISFEIFKNNTKLNGSIKGENVSFNVDIKVQANIAEDQCSLKLSEPIVIKKLEKQLEKKILETSHSAIEKLQEDYQSDIVGFGEYLHRTDNKNWRSIESEWKETFPSIDIQINVKAKIKRTGTITESFQ